VAVVSEYAASYNSFSGVDMKATFGNKTIAELQGISISITREKAPNFTMGSPEPRAFSRGKRGIAGTMVFQFFDRMPILETLGRDSSMKFQADKDSIHPEFEGGEQRRLDFSLASGAGSAVTPSTPVGGGIAANPAVVQQEMDVTQFVNEDQEAAYAWYLDQLPPFDVTLVAANEHGALATMRIFGVEILNMGYGISVDDLNSEIQCTYIARSCKPWEWVRPADYFISRAQG
jgi:hypothetical protein